MAFLELIQRIEWRLYKSFKRLRLHNQNATIIADNCNGGLIMHDMGMRFNTPTVNLFIMPGDYLKFLQNLPHYLKQSPSGIQDDTLPYPVGKLDDITVYFMHYKTFADAYGKWCERAKRVDLDNLYILMTDRNGCTQQQMEEFDKLPFAHKVLFTHIPHPEIKCACYIPGFETQDSVGVLSDFQPSFWRRRYLDKFDYVSFLNQTEK